MERTADHVLAALHPDPATMRLDDELAEREAEPRAAHARNVRRLYLFELAEDDVMVLRRNAHAVVGDGKERPVVLLSCAERDRHRARRVRQRVLHEIAKDPLQ